MADNGYNPTQDYNTAYDALRARIATSFAGKRADLNQELATRGVNTSGVSAIPSSRLSAAQAGEEAGAASNFALEQARTGVQDRQMATQFANEKELAQLGWNNQDAISRRMANSGLQAAVISGGIGALGSVFSGSARR